MNRLGAATSPYLLQHADNPVDWWEWEPEAFEEARRRNVPVLLSVGYAACHWCHVMAHESFEDEATAAYLNEHFVSIKVDREERPDVDAVYMDATTSMTGHGGWPMTCVLDHDGNPFFAGTYFPDQPRHGQPSFRQVLEALTDAWRDQARGRAAGGRQRCASTCSRATADGRRRDHRGDAGRAVELLGREYDAVNGGFGGAPKFPPSMVLELPAAPRRRPARRRCMVDDTSRRWRAAASTTSSAAASRATPSTRAWVVPHFEKMLYDNAQLLGLYARVGGPLGDAGRPRDRRLPAPRAAHRRGRLRLRARRGQRGRRGQVLRLDAGPARRGARSGGRRLGGAGLSVTEAGTFEHGTLHPPAARRARDPRGSGAARRRTPPAARGARRSGSARPATTRWSPPGTAWPSPASATPGCGSASSGTSTRRSPRASCCGGCTSSTVGCGGSRGTASSARPRACSRTTAAWRPASSRSCRRPATRVWLDRARPLLDDGDRAVPRRRRRLLRHRRRRRGAGRPAPRPRRQRVAVGAVVDGARAGRRARADRRGPLPDRSPRRRWPPSRRWPRRRRGSPAGRWPPRRRW